MRPTPRRLAALPLLTAALLAPALPMAAGAEEITSAYTDLDLAKCRHTASKEVADGGSWRCRGHGGIDVHVAEGDLRMFVSFGPDARNQPAAEQTFPGFNNVDRKRIEWRIAREPGGKATPFATILRWDVTIDAEGSSRQVLVVTRLGRHVCQVGYVLASGNPEANGLARKLADTQARAFDCAKDEPGTMGPRGSLFEGRRRFD